MTPMFEIFLYLTEEKMADYNDDPFVFGNFNVDDIFRQLNGQMANMQQANNGSAQARPGNTGGNNNKKKNGLLEQFGINITEQARKGKLDPVIGRGKEVERVIEILNRRTKNNPVLIGEPGVGKTAVVEGLAQAIVAKKVPDKLMNKEVIRLDMVSLVQGTSMRGQFEARMQQLMKEVESRDEVILFIDEIHEIMGAGNAEGGMDAGNILKPALARGEFQLIGATTLKEYRNIEKDGAVSRRFQEVMVEEPSRIEAVEILKGLRPKYEGFHHVKYPDDVLETAVDLSDRYIPERFLPDKAIDLIDEAGSRKNLHLEFVSSEEIQQKINNAEAMKQQAIEKEDYEKASYWRDQVDNLQKQKKIAEENPENVANAATVTVSDIAKIIEEKTKIPVGDLKKNEASQLKDLDTHLRAHVIGQNEAVERVSRAVRRNRIGLTKSGRPIGSFLFVGPTGVGKTETAKQLSKEMFGSEESMIRFDMSEYMEPQSISKLIGAPAGYVGYEEAGQLTEQVRRHPYSLILLDEIEKAHRDVMNMFLQILDDGRLTDSQGHVVSFKDTIVIATSNAGSGDVGNNPVGFAAETAEDSAEHRLVEKLKNYFKPEFLNRFDAIVEFKELGKSELSKITDLMLNQMNSMLADNNLHVDVDKAAKDKLVELGFNPEMGARPLRRVVQEQIEDKVADFYLDNPNAHQLRATLNKDGKIVLVPKKINAPAKTVPSDVPATNQKDN
ncbi:ATP-dependent Clp protease ATP-binding subunit [Oenococcus oeni]|uniref:ATP-dependent Clp protease ATP-binding subunit n=2 Tax=Oenococcus oeni TaxID=1247 RepID=UPI0008F95F3C|nr:ATP-dependent Clp protease ATP-binding subunit [Oenococcus oeni]OIK62011.1 ATP-dependent Clp protease ATP-binding subunit [Oenococcus oeni]OIK89093.1 ATP-dependent Clp protease ATP-binding subunit [Oenococcus oeni]OIL87789.1 ATP-dependent Clp protease ATP-binding subunit [Oenococcus oeni]OIM71647.1 ATP-dependent Clp protease ATP-binding subunit [Oenococcus oeni]OLQ31797.1 ATP-dependent Clp protease ATP-binding subunit [Oenococcus oeni]